MTKADVFISYKREDEAIVAKMVASFEAEGLVVWWDRDIEGASGWRDAIHQRLTSAACVIVVWSEASVSGAGEFVQDEAAVAKSRGSFLPVRVDKVEPPLGFGQQQALDLVGWRGNRRDPRFHDVLEAVKALVNGRPIPPPQAPRRRMRQRAIGGGAIVFTAALIGFVFNLFGAQNTLCQGPFRDVCAIVSIGGVPSVQDEAVFEQARADGCDGLRAFIESGRGGVLQFEADRLLSARRTETVTEWVEIERRLPLYEPSLRNGQSSETAARTAVATQAEQQARELCSGMSQSDMFRERATSLAIENANCRNGADGWRCSLEGAAICALESRETREVEICDGVEPSQ
ncbi:toll/interleukin-1 receptor domain-containing protein [Hyphobacterium sp. CCMP332]|uniref:toll/interleukin-1 receptor domain-containing protein n=1 Tax=Hyphobacterium sp. CCMP332 TaxID=2749086 RepID=UPI001650CBDE|nr:toll/interleukin-1 receptor domain-containing protein [Hyphobacterium sp. CCMP332]QNL19690.1 toll/interleukin-1 receptor domain-containing protein [Hyphobacterium sp. CCMP332]